jgi:hypothetical protein
MMGNILTPEVRQWIYNVSMAVIPLLVMFGVFDQDVAGQVALIIAAVLGLSSNAIARANVTKPSAPAADDDARG